MDGTSKPSTSVKKPDYWLGLTNKLVVKAQDAAVEELDVFEGCNILELGCNDGEMILKILKKYKEHDLHIDGVESRAHAIDIAKKRIQKEAKEKAAKVSLKHQDYIKYLGACEKKKYDIVIASFILTNVENSKLFRSVYKVLREKGKFIILTKSSSHFEGLEEQFTKYAMQNPHLFHWSSFLHIITHKKFSYVLPLKETVGLLYKAKFSKVMATEKEILSEKKFEEPTDFARWVCETCWSGQHTSNLKKDKKEIFCKGFAEFLDWGNVRVNKEPIRLGEPFKFICPLYLIIAEK